MSQELVLIGGFPAAGKTTLTKEFEDKGYVRLNRDKKGGLLAKLAEDLQRIFITKKSVVCDNLFPTVESRSDFVAAAKEFGIPARFIHLNTSFEDAQFNACVRMVQSLGKILDPNERADSPNLFPVAVLYKYRKEFVAASTAEGFSSVEKVGFKRQNPATWKNKAIIVDYDGTLRETKSGAKFPVDPEDIKILPGRAKKLKEYQNQGYLLLGVSNQSGVAKGQLTRKQADACFERTNKLLGLDIEVSYCPHSVPPITCYCRKPGPGLGVEFILKHKLNPSQCIMVGDMTTDKTFAARCGFKFVDQEVFFR